jgi:two-component system phosphate regulon sensor histidine kinase PhoR
MPTASTRRARIAPGHLVVATLVAAAAPILVLTALVVVGALKPAPAVGAVSACVGAGFLVARWHLAKLVVLRDFADRLLTTNEPPPPEARGGGPIHEVVSAIARLHRGQRDLLDEGRRLVAARDQVLDGVLDPLMLLDGEGRVVGVNQSARDLFGREARGRDLAHLVRDPEILDAVAAARTDSEPRTVHLTLPVPIERDFVVGVRPLARAAPDGTALILSFHDVTALRRAEQMRADFAANASHEIRTPLAALIGFIETLRGPAKQDHEAAERFLAIMQEQAQRMARLVDDLLSLARIEVNEHQAPTARVDLGQVVREVAASLELQAARRRMRINLDDDFDLPEVLGDPDELAQLVQNLIDNAIKYGRPGTPVSVRVARAARAPVGFPPGGALLLEVRDEGDGIGREHLPRLTERFYRVDPARSRSAGGTGLGLAIVKHIVARHRGHLAIDSEVGVGSTFSVLLPIAAYVTNRGDLSRRSA